MIYIEEKDFDRQIKLLSHLATNRRLVICAWLYPESRSRSIAGFCVSEASSKLQPITTYEEGAHPKHTELVSASESNILSFQAAATDLSANCDSLVLYKEGSSSWFAAAIGHEGMCLVKDNSLLSVLIDAGFSASNEAPSWW